jgi:hypothetical protein
MIEVTARPNSLNTYRYDVAVRGRRSHGFRSTPEKARDAAREDEGMLYMCAFADHAEEKAEDQRPRRRRERDEG